MVSVSRLESLPREIFDAIVARSGTHDLVELLHCNKRLHECVEPPLYRRKHVQNMAMLWACKNNCVETIRRLVGRYGASASTVETVTYPTWNNPVSNSEWNDNEAWPIIRRMSTLYITLRCGRDESRCVRAARALLELGARIEPAGVSDVQVESLLSMFLANNAWPKLRVFLEARLDAVIDEIPTVDRMLLTAAGRRAPDEFVRFLLDRGADPNFVEYTSHDSAMMSPLAAAIFQQHSSMVRLLLAHGADIRGAHPGKAGLSPARLPMFAAVQVMAEQPGGETMVQLCLDCGADINQYMAVRYGRGACHLTPLLFYLHSMQNWDWKGQMDGIMRPAEALTFLFDKGASIEVPYNTSNRGPVRSIPPRALDILMNNRVGVGRRQLQSQISEHDYLPYSNSVSLLTRREFFNAAAVLVRHGDAATRGYIEFLLDQGTRKHNKAFETEETSGIWRSFVSLLFDMYISYNGKHYTDRHRQDPAAVDADAATDTDMNMDTGINIDVTEGLNLMLGRFIRELGISITETVRGVPREAGDFSIVVDDLLRRPGVDINSPCFGGQRTVLHELCAAYREMEVEHRRSCVQGLKQDTPMKMRNDSKRQFLRYLVHLGADPRLAMADAPESKAAGAVKERVERVDGEIEKRQAKARTALDALREPGVAEMVESENGGKGADYLTETSREHLESLAAALEGDWEASEKHWDKATEHDDRILFHNKALFSRLDDWKQLSLENKTWDLEDLRRKNCPIQEVP